MKIRLTLTTATALGLIMTTAAFAGGSSTYLSQDGHGQSAAIDQSGSTSGATVGTSTTDPFIQDDGAKGGVAGTGYNVLVINQNSNTNSGFNLTPFVSAGAGNSVTGFQSGSNNSAEIDQEGNNSSVELNQTGANNGLPSSGDWFNNTPGNIVLQDSSASGSTVVLHQTSDAAATKGAVFSIGQGGINNHINATQTATSSQSAHSDLWIRQGTTAPGLWDWGGGPGDYFSPSVTANSLSSTLSNSSITVNQTVGGASGVNYAALGQGAGSGNHLYVTQLGAANNADVNQVGSSNYFSSTQTNSAVYVDVHTNWNFVGGEYNWPDGSVNPITGLAGVYGPITQSGDGNSYINSQTGTNLWALGSQSGDDHHLTNTQVGDANKLYSVQTGNDNTINNQQTGTNGTATYTQSGSYNVATLQDQQGSSNTVEVTQLGTGTLGNENTITMLQQGGSVGSPNSIVMSQSGGAGNDAYLVQGGLFNKLGLTTTLTLTGGLAGNGNHINGSQAGDTNYVAVSQNGSTNTAAFTQNGSGNVATISQ